MILKGDFSVETLEARRQWNDIVSAEKRLKIPRRIPYLAKLSIKNEGIIKILKREREREFVAGRPTYKKY